MRTVLRKLVAALVPLPACALALGPIACSDSDSNDGVGPESAAIELSAKNFAFNDTVGRTAPLAVTIEVTTAGDVPVGGLAVGDIQFAPGGSGWLTATLSSSTTPSTLTVTPTPSALPPGTYAATIPIQSDDASNSPQNVIVTLTRNPAPLPPLPNIGGVTILAGGNPGQCGGSLQRATAQVVAAAHPDWLFVLGDNAHARSGPPITLADYMACYDPVWGRFKGITYAAVGEKEQDSLGVSAAADAYFGPARVGPSGKNFYSFDIGGWHIIVLNVVSGGPLRPVRYNNGSEQLEWLRRDLAANYGRKCTLALWHDPMWISSSNPPSPTDPYPNHGYRDQPIRGVWIALYEYDADVVVNGGRHIYERFAPMRYEGGYSASSGPEFAADSVRGIRQFSSGLIGDGPLTTPEVLITHPLSEYRSGGNGILKLTLGDGQYTWQFLNTQHSNIRDQGVGRCH
jgi:hypothetical protein